jgi:hypothetical protein
VKKKAGRSKTRRRGGAPSARIPLPAKRPARHGDETKYDRAREKARLRGEIRRPEGE